MQNFVSLSRGTIAATAERETDRQIDRQTHTPEAHFIIQVSEVTDRVLFVHENLMLVLASCAQYLA
jgi:hypothetical protein